MTSPITALPERVLTVFEDDATIAEFKKILQGGTNAFIKSALICIASSSELMNCSPNSLANGALRSAALGLSLDPALRQAYLVPRKGVACFQPHYAGLYDLAVRTNQYRYISVMPIHQGERVLQDPQTGLHYWARGGSETLFAPVQGEGGLRIDNMRDVTSGSPTAPVIGYLGYFKTKHGFEKSVWMTLVEIQTHALTWSPASYNSKYGAWQDPKKRPTMEMKTVFIKLSKFMDLSGGASSKLREALQEDETVEAETIDAIEPVYEDIDEVDQAFPLDDVAELPIESTIPGPMRKPVTTVANETTGGDGAWDDFQKLVEQAKEAGLNLPLYERDKMDAKRIEYAGMYIIQQLEKISA
jgi:recombination protein RecT